MVVRARLTEMHFSSIAGQNERIKNSQSGKKSQPELVVFRTEGKSSMQNPIPPQPNKKRNHLSLCVERIIFTFYLSFTSLFMYKIQLEILQVPYERKTAIRSTQLYGNPFHD